ncbi:DUF3379 domain-containing protein [Vibrio mytili]|uniref:DUF3379 domain-containing protein n=1 Tax=Vibrio mytili TaxID=50718 RepID=UPI002F42E19A
MDDLEFRRRILSDPKHLDKETLQSLKDNETNRKFVDDVLDLDAKINQAMSIDVPEDLADKILFTQSSASHHEKVHKPMFARKALALAASIAFTAGLLVGQVNWGNVLLPPAHASLAEMAIKHVVNEEAFVRHLDENVPNSQINAKMLPFQYHFIDQFPYHVYYLNHCGFGKSNAVHMVFQGNKGKVTLFMTAITSDQQVTFKEDGMNGSIVPMGNVSMILIGEHDEDTESLANTLVPLIKPMS